MTTTQIIWIWKELLKRGTHFPEKLMQKVDLQLRSMMMKLQPDFTGKKATIIYWDTDEGIMRIETEDGKVIIAKDFYLPETKNTGK
jgi:hypothetical protein